MIGKILNIAREQIKLLDVKKYASVEKSPEEGSKNFTVFGSSQKPILSVIDEEENVSLCIFSNPCKEIIFYKNQDIKSEDNRRAFIEFRAEFTAELIRERYCDKEIEREITLP